MGWSGETIALDVTLLVDAHGGEREERGERLYAELRKRLRAAVREVLTDPKWEENSDAIQVWEWNIPCEDDD